MAVRRGRQPPGSGTVPDALAFSRSDSRIRYEMSCGATRSYCARWPMNQPSHAATMPGSKWRVCSCSNANRSSAVEGTPACTHFSGMSTVRDELQHTLGRASRTVKDLDNGGDDRLAEQGAVLQHRADEAAHQFGQQQHGLDDRRRRALGWQHAVCHLFGEDQVHGAEERALCGGTKTHRSSIDDLRCGANLPSWLSQKAHLLRDRLRG